MTPNKHYEVLESIEINGTLHDAGAVIELGEAEAQPFVDAGKLKEHGEGSAPATVPPTPPQNEPGSQATPASTPEQPAAPAAPAPETPSTPAAAPVAAEKKEEKSWVGHHTVGGNEPARVGGSVTERHADLSGKK